MTDTPPKHEETPANPQNSTASMALLAPPLLVVALAVLYFFFLPPLSQVGLWDPYELKVADLARRMAVTLHGASGLALGGVDNSLPHLNDSSGARSSRSRRSPSGSNTSVCTNGQGVHLSRFGASSASSRRTDSCLVWSIVAPAYFRRSRS